MTNTEFMKYLAGKLNTVRAERKKEGITPDEDNRLSKQEGLLVSMSKIMAAGGPGARRVRRDYERRLQKGGISINP